MPPLTNGPRNPWPVLAAGLFSLSWASTFILLCEAPAAVIAFYRVVGATLILLPLLVGTWKRRPSFSIHWPAVVAGILVAFHWAAWIQSVQLTTVASAVFLVATQPIFAVLLGYLFLGERVGMLSLIGVLLAFAGVWLIAGVDGGEQHWIGNLLALGSALVGAAYLLIGRRSREEIEFLPYLFTVYTVASFCLGILVLFLRLPFYPYSLRTLFWIGMLAVICSLIGHGSLNWSVRKMRAYLVNLAVLTEPVLATFYAFWWFGQRPSPWIYSGAALVVAGLAAAVLDERRGMQKPVPGNLS